MALWTPLQHIVSAAPVITNIPLQLRIITLNVRYATSSPSTGERPWVEREPLILNQLYHELRHMSLSPSQNNMSSINQPFSSCCAAFICLQEALHNQLVDVLAGLNEAPTSERNEDPSSGPSWAHVGVGRDDGDRKGEYSPILYPVKIFSLLDSETVWLSPTPHKPSKGWDAGSIRILTIAVFEHIRTKQRVLAANTHLDNAGSQSRAESVKIILATMRRIHKKWSTRGTDLAVFLAGDFNSFPEQEAYVAIKEDAWLRDLHEDIEPQQRYGNVITFTGFQPDKEKDEQGRIDFLWLGPCGSGSDDKTPWTPVGYAVLPNIFENGIYLSDHRAVVGDMLLYP